MKESVTFTRERLLLGGIFTDCVMRPPLHRWNGCEIVIKWDVVNVEVTDTDGRVGISARKLRRKQWTVRTTDIES